MAWDPTTSTYHALMTKLAAAAGSTSLQESLAVDWSLTTSQTAGGKTQVQTMLYLLTKVIKEIEEVKAHAAWA